MLVTAVLFSLVTFYHLFAVPKPTSDKSTLAADAATAGAIFREFGRTFATYFTKPGALLAIVFMLLYRLPEAFLIKMCMPFLVASKESGGLELSTAEVGIVYGTIGVIFLTLGGILGGLFASRIGLKKSIMPDVCLSCHCPARQSVCHLHRHRHRAIRLRLRFHGLHALHDVLLRR